MRQESYTVTPEKDVLGRSTGKVISTGSGDLAGEYVYYRKVGDHATNMPSAVYFGGMKNGKYAISDHVKYEYDKRGNIAKIFENGALSVRYCYDSIDRLIREDNKALKSTTLYTYDNCGNILSKRQTAFTLKENVEECEFTEVRYAYEGDKLLSYGEEVCEYDTIGNATLYRGKVAKYGKGRQLQEYNGVSFSYDGQGRRIGKNGITYTYDGNGNLISDSNGLEYLYDHAGIFAVKYQNATYFYRKDIQGNILALLDENGAVVVQYKYDAWGNHAVLDGAGNDISDDDTHIGYLNPFRYRGYFYDVETELYYLQTRYYDPEVGRFITIDGVEYLDPETINGLNLYVYCGNNPVMRTDPTGEFVLSAFLLFLFSHVIVPIIVGTAAGAVIGAAAGGITAAINGTNIWEGIGKGALIGGLFGASVASIAIGVGNFATTSLAFSVFVGAGAGSAFALGANTYNQLNSGDFGNISLETIFVSWGKGLLVGALAGATSYIVKSALAYYGERLALSIAGKSFLGVNIANSKLLFEIGGIAGGFLGGFLGGQLINHLATDSGFLNVKLPLWLNFIFKIFGKGYGAN